MKHIPAQIFFLKMFALLAVGIVPGMHGAAAQQDIHRAEPEPTTGLVQKRLVRGEKHMVVAAHPLAAEAGREVLRRGGSAIDAVIAVQMVLNLVEPQSSGIGGGAFILHWDAKTRTLTSYDGRETAPAAARPDRFLGPDGKPHKFGLTRGSGLSVGVPGVLRALEMAHKAHGKLPWKTLFGPAIAHARRGFEVSPRLHKLLMRVGPSRFDAVARSYFFDSHGAPRPVGYRLTNPALAQTLETIAERGPDAFYSGEIAADIVARVRSTPRLPGDMTLADIAGYRAVRREPVCGAYRGRRVCGMGPPSSGGITILQVLGMIEPFDLGRKPLDPRSVHLIVEAEKLAYADRARYLADADFIRVPKGLIDPEYLAGRRSLINPGASIAKALPGKPPAVGSFGVDATVEHPGTSHISIVDAQGNAVAMTTTIEQAFGSGLMVRGFLLNNELTDFSPRPLDRSGRPVANRVQPGKRPRSSMSPTMVFDETGNLFMVTGSPGGSRIILYVLKTLIGVIDWGLDAQAAVSLANFGSRRGPVELERGTQAADLVSALGKLGHEFRISPMTSGLHVIVVRGDELEGGADPRREGQALAD